jgi:hypothetical protein
VVSAATELERDVRRLQRDLERYRLATEAALDTVDEAIAWLDRNRRADLARGLRRNRAAIERRMWASDEPGDRAARGRRGT